MSNVIPISVEDSTKLMLKDALFLSKEIMLKTNEVSGVFTVNSSDVTYHVPPSTILFELSYSIYVPSSFITNLYGSIESGLVSI